LKITKTSLPGVVVVTPAVHRDDRGAFWETWNQHKMELEGLPGPWVQDNFSLSKKNVIRGIHYQIVKPQGKLVRATHGAILDVAIDLRRSSPSFAKHVAVELDGETGEMLWIPEGFGHGFLALTDIVGMAYKITDDYCPAGERTIVWNDPDLAIPWPVDEQNAILSEKDRAGLPLQKAEVFL
jgi:dTDP-4-dehydrorhamnose 3,5-epimerase